MATKTDTTEVNLSKSLSKDVQFKRFAVWIIGDTPLITHAWSQKNKGAMLAKQVKATKGGKEVRDPHADYVASLYQMGDDEYGFPATGVKNCILSSAHKDKGIARTDVMKALWIDAEMMRVMPAMAGAACDMPLIRIHGSSPEMREDMVKVGAGLQKKASLAYRGQFTVWAMRVTGRFNSSVITDQALAFLFNQSGVEAGLGEWRNERKGMFGAFHLATAEEEHAWNAYASGRGKLPIPASYENIPAIYTKERVKAKPARAPARSPERELEPV